jgi:hypothetical protein
MPTGKLLLYFRNMPTGINSLSDFSTPGTCQLDIMIFELLLYFRNMPTGINSLSGFCTSGTFQQDLMIF